MHPMLCLEAKVECFFGLAQAGRQDLKHIRLGIACVYELIRSRILAGSEREALAMLERVTALAASEYGIQLRLEDGVVIMDAIPLSDLEAGAPALPKLAAFLEKRWPQLEARIRSRSEAFARKFRPKKTI